jgi:hypothetical protein
MEIKTTIVSISREELVNLFATGLYGSNYLDADYESNDDLADCECFEDKLAQSVLAGRSITFRDMYAEGYAHGELPRVIDDNDEDVIYTVTLDDIKRGLEKAAETCPWAFRAFADEDSPNWDYYAGDALLQTIVFGELIYG